MKNKLLSFLSFYAKSFEKKDIEAILSCYEFPFTLRHNNQNHFFEKIDFKTNLEELLKKYCEKDFAQANFKLLNNSLKLENCLQASVCWELKDKKGNVFSTFNCLYQITNSNDQLTIFNVINFNENS